jgi:hypothetical protein
MPASAGALRAGRGPSCISRRLKAAATAAAGGVEGTSRRRPEGPARTADPKKVKKIDLDFCQFFLHFWLRLLDAVLMNSDEL